MLYIIYTKDINNSLEKRLSVYSSYLAHLQVLRDEGRLLMSGLMPAIDSNDPGSVGFTGSAVISKFESLKEASIWAETDPNLLVGVYKKVSIKPYKKIL